jgi:hypothetical protein
MQVYGKIMSVALAVSAMASVAHCAKPLKEASDTTKSKLAKLQVGLTTIMLPFLLWVDNTTLSLSPYLSEHTLFIFPS